MVDQERPTTDAVPRWAFDLAVGVEGIKGKTDQIPGLVLEIKELRAQAVPMSAHLELRADVEKLMEQNIGAQSTWNEMVERVPRLWDDRIKQEGRQQAHRAWLLALTAVVAVLTGLVALQSLGLTVAVHHG